MYLFWSYSLVVVLFTMQSCKPDWKQKQIVTENGNVLIKTFDSTGKLAEVKTYREGDSLHYCILKYDKIGILYDSIPYVGRQKHGERKTLDAKDNITYTSYVNGEEYGEVRAYYDNAVMEYTGQVRGKDHQVGEWRFYDRSGRIQSYDYYNFKGELVYIRKYDSTGNTITSKGWGIIETTNIADTIAVAEPFSFTVRVAHPPNCIVEVFYGRLNPRDSSFISRTRADLEKDEALIQDTFESPGLKMIGFEWELNDIKNGKKKREKCKQFLIFHAIPHKTP